MVDRNKLIDVVQEETFAPSITGADVRELRTELRQSLTEFGITLKRALDRKAAYPYSRQYISGIENGRFPITREIETAFFAVASEADGVSPGVAGAIEITVFGNPNNIKPGSLIPANAKSKLCERVGCGIYFIPTNPMQKYHDPCCSPRFRKKQIPGRMGITGRPPKGEKKSGRQQ